MWILILSVFTDKSNKVLSLNKTCRVFIEQPNLRSHEAFYGLLSMQLWFDALACFSNFPAHFFMSYLLNFAPHCRSLQERV